MNLTYFTHSIRRAELLSDALGKSRDDLRRGTLVAVDIGLSPASDLHAGFQRLQLPRGYN